MTAGYYLILGAMFVLMLSAAVIALYYQQQMENMKAQRDQLSDVVDDLAHRTIRPVCGRFIRHDYRNQVQCRRCGNPSPYPVSEGTT